MAQLSSSSNTSDQGKICFGKCKQSSVYALWALLMDHFKNQMSLEYGLRANR